MHEVSARLFESLPELGGQVKALYPEKFIYDVFGLPRILGRDLIRNQIKQIEPFGQEVHPGVTVLDIHHDEKAGLFRLETDAGAYPTRTVIITCGMGRLRSRPLPIVGADGYLGKGLEYSVGRKEAFSGQNVVIFGGGDSAVDWALDLQPVARRVTLVHRRDEFRAHEATVQKIHRLHRRGQLDLLTPVLPDQIRGADRVESVIVKLPGGKRKALPADAVLVFFGFKSDPGPVAEWGLEMNKGRLLVDQQMRTNRAGIFAAGDVIDFEGKIKLIATGYAEAAQAVKSAIEFAYPERKVKTVFSSTQGPPSRRD